MKNFPVTVDGKEYWISRSVAAVSYVYTIKDGQVYVLANKRGSGAPSNVGKWNAPSGFVDYNETVEQCAIRETFEETGVVVRHTQMKELDDSPERIGQNILVRFACYVPMQETTSENCEPNEVDEIRWIPLSEVKNYEWTSERHMDKMIEYGLFYKRYIPIVTKYNELEPFDENIENIPMVPITDRGIYDNVVVPNLIRCGAIPKDKLVSGATYEGTCRNTNVAVWNGETNTFLYLRYKFGARFYEPINHFEDDNGLDVFVPIRMIKDNK